MEKWAFTIKYNPNGLTEDEYKAKIQYLVDKWKDNGVEVIKFLYEDQDKKGHRTKIHAHGLIAIKRGLYRRKLMIDDYHVKLVAYYSKNWDDYCTKNQINQKLLIKVHDKREEATNEEEPDDDNQIPIPQRSLFSQNI